MYVYKEVWSAVVGETLACHRETRNLIDPYAVAVMRSGEVIGHVPRSISTLCSLFIERGGNITCELQVTDSTLMIYHKEG